MPIKPIIADIGRWVVYTHQWYDNANFHGRGDIKAEVGTITNFNSNVAFVKYEGNEHSKATLLENLRWYWMMDDPPHAWEEPNEFFDERVVAHHSV
jgi:hypothetical protein